MAYTDQQIREKALQLEKAGAPPSDIEEFVKRAKTEQTVQPTKTFGERFLENLVGAPKKLFIDIPTAVAKPGVEAIGEFAKPAVRPLAQIGVAAGRTFRGESPQQPAYLPGPLGKALGDVGIGTPGEEIGKAIETGLTVSPGTVLKPVGKLLKPAGELLKPVQKLVGQGGEKIIEKVLRIPKKTIEAGKSPAEFFLKEAPITTESKLKKIIGTESRRLQGEVDNILASRPGKISVLTNEVENDLRQMISNSTFGKGASQQEINRLVQQIKDKTILGERKALTVKELNDVRKYIDNVLLKESQHLTPRGGLAPSGQALADAADTLRIKVQTLAPETKPLFARWSKFIIAERALDKIPRTAVKDYAAALLGTLIQQKESVVSEAGGALAGFGLGRIFRATPTQLTLAKILAGLSKAKVGPNTVQAARALPFLFNKPQVPQDIQ